MIGRRKLEKVVETDIRLELNAEGVMVMKHHVDNRGQKPCVKCGHVDEQRGARTGLGIGVSDLICVVPPLGRFMPIEVKRAGWRESDVSEDQKCFLRAARAHGAVGGVAGSVEEALEILRVARGG